MCLNVILPNLSLAFSSVTFYQVARIMLTPTVALMNFVLYRATLPMNAILALVPACFGVGVVSYYDSLPTNDANVKTTSTLGIVFAFTGIFASSLYTVWIGSYHKKLQMNSMQLLFNQAPVAAFLLLYVIPFVDTFPVWSEVPLPRWALIMLVCIFLLLHKIASSNKSITVRMLRFPYQPVPVLHRCADGPSLKYSGGPSQDLLHRRSRLDGERPCRGGQEHLWGADCCWWYHWVLDRDAEA
jgi:drug/metabolite transporter (DMT)-like permease